LMVTAVIRQKIIYLSYVHIAIHKLRFTDLKTKEEVEGQFTKRD